MSISSHGVALVTGASSGIGAIYADRLARRGHDLILVGRDEARLRTVADRVSGSNGISATTVSADLNDRDDLWRIEALLRERTDLAMLVNNAGVGAVTPLLQSDIADMEAMIGLNVTALTRLTYAAAPAFVARGGGTIINIGSIVAIAPETLNGVYGATKAFVLAFSLSLHRELADKGIRIQAVLPGATATGFWDAAGVSLDGLPSEIVMRAEDMVDAALAGLDEGELVTIPSLPDFADWQVYEAARQGLIPQLSRNAPAARYSVKRAA